MKTFSSFAEAAADFARMEAAAAAQEQAALRAIGERVAKTAREKHGVYQRSVGHWPPWQGLSEVRKARREADGYSRDEPLLARGSVNKPGAIRGDVSFDVRAASVVIGSPSELHVYHEFGTEKMPPRPVFGPALLENVPEILALSRGMVVAMFSSDGRVVR